MPISAGNALHEISSVTELIETATIAADEAAIAIDDGTPSSEPVCDDAIAAVDYLVSSLKTALQAAEKLSADCQPGAGR